MPHKDKRLDRIQVNYSVPREVKAIIDAACGVKSRVHGEFVAMCVYEHMARLEERARVVRELAQARQP